jgi:YidC/Oxa1 family membrane protein insertase
MERRVLLAIFLCFLVLYLWNALVVKPVPKPAVATTTAGASDRPALPAERPDAARPPATTAQPKPTARPALGTPLVGETSERDVRVETRDVIAVFTNRGARLKSWRLKHYRDQQQEPQELVVGVDLQPLPFELRAADEGTTALINSALYAVDQSTDGATRLRFEYRTAAPELHVVKEFGLAPQGYIVTFDAKVTAAPPEPATDKGSVAVPVTILWGPAVGDLGEVSRYAQKPEGLLAQNGSVQRPSDFSKQSEFAGDFRYAGVDDNYFMTVALSVTGAKVRYQPVSIPPPPGSKDPAHSLVAYSIELAPSNLPVKFFVGPKDFEVLAAIDTDMTSAINFGYFKVIVVPLLQSLKWVHGYVGNYGWSIVILTLLINAIMFPLRHKSAVSMRKMQQIQPEVKSIQDRYSKLKTTDPARQKMNTELMALYRDRGVNPASGCVPMLLTMPVFLAMWALLQTSIELRGAPWFGWIHDLSSHDRFYVLPVIMVVSQFWQQRLMPQAGADPAQQKMMMFMPAVMGFIFLWLPAGALIYYVISNLWAIGQQYLTNRLLGPPTVRTVRPAAERRVKRVGGGKTEAAAREP